MLHNVSILILTIIKTIMAKNKTDVASFKYDAGTFNSNTFGLVANIKGTHNKRAYYIGALKNGIAKTEIIDRIKNAVDDDGKTIADDDASLAIEYISSICSRLDDKERKEIAKAAGKTPVELGINKKQTPEDKGILPTFAKVQALAFIVWMITRFNIDRSLLNKNDIKLLNKSLTLHSAGEQVSLFMEVDQITLQDFDCEQSASCFVNWVRGQEILVDVKNQTFESFNGYFDKLEENEDKSVLDLMEQTFMRPRYQLKQAKDVKPLHTRIENAVKDIFADAEVERKNRVKGSEFIQKHSQSELEYVQTIAKALDIDTETKNGNARPKSTLVKTIESDEYAGRLGAILSDKKDKLHEQIKKLKGKN